MATLADISAISRQFSRDFGTFFELNYASVGSTIRLPHPLVQAGSVSVVDNSTGDPVTDFVLNSRNGLLKVNNPAAYTDGLYVSGLYYQWFLDEDFDFFSRVIVTEHMHHRTGVSLESITGAEVEVMGTGALVLGLYSLLAEFATDIDISSPEGMSIPVHQRYQQVLGLIQYWEKKYDDKAALLNVGLKKIETFTLRRKSRLTDRYVPVYRTREIDNPRPPIRVRPPIDPEEPTPFEDEEAYWASNGENVTTESFDFGWGGWGTIGTGGSP